MFHRPPAGLALAGALVLGPSVAAGQATDSLGLTGNVGVVNTAGNTDLTTVSLGEEARWRRGRLTLGQSFTLVYGRSAGETTSSTWRAALRGDHELTEGVSAYVAVGFLRDRFAGIARRVEEGTGIGFALLSRPRDRLELETGLALVQQRSTLGPQDDFGSARGAAAYVHHFGGEARVRQQVETTFNLENGSDYGVTSETTLLAPLSRRLALKMSYMLRFDHQPEPGFRTTDRLLTTGLQFTL